MHRCHFTHDGPTVGVNLEAAMLEGVFWEVERLRAIPWGAGPLRKLEKF
jgi:hypothetical protein